MQKRMAVLFFGHARTYQRTYKKFFENVIEPNAKDGWKIDIFIHTWDELTSSKGSWYEKHNHNLKINAELEGKVLSDEDRKNLQDFYQPKKLLIQKQEQGQRAGHSKEQVCKMCAEYELEQDFKYDYYIFTRPDIYFYSTFRLLPYLELYQNEPVLKNLKLPKEHIFIAANLLMRMPVIDIRYINELDLFYISSFLGHPLITNEPTPLYILINYRLGFNYFIFRANDDEKVLNPLIQTHKSVLTNYESEISRLRNINAELKTKLNALPRKISEQELINLKLDENVKKIQVKEMEQNLNIKKLEVKKLEKELGLKLSKLEPRVVLNLNENLRNSAVARARNHLAYRLGAAIIVCNKSFFGILSLPFVLSFIKAQYKKEQVAYQSLIKQRPELKLPALETYPDYQASLKEKECFTYKLGEAMMRADKTWLSGGYIKFYFEAKKLEREFKKNFK